MYAMSIRTEVRCAMKDTILVVRETGVTGMIFKPEAGVFGPRNENFCGRFATVTDENLHDRSSETDGSDDTEEHQGHARAVETN